MKKILVDTDILIDYTKGHDRWLETLLKQQSTGEVDLYISVVNVTEFFSDKKLENKQLLGKATEFIELFTCLEATRSISLLAGSYIRRGLVNFLGDALIGATCVSGNLNLATRNIKHFKRIPGLQLYS